MDRRSLVTGLACWPVRPLLAQDGQRPHQKLSAAQLYEALSARFPVRFGIPGVAQIQISAAQMLLLPTRNKLGASLHAEAIGSGMPRVEPGLVDLVFALRYEHEDRSIRAYEPEIVGINWKGLTVEALQALQVILPSVAREVAAELVLHRFTPRELALPDAMGLEPAFLTVAEDGVLVEFREKHMR